MVPGWSGSKQDPGAGCLSRCRRHPDQPGKGASQNVAAASPRPLNCAASQRNAARVPDLGVEPAKARDQPTPSSATTTVARPDAPDGQRKHDRDPDHRRRDRNNRANPGTARLSVTDGVSTGTRSARPAERAKRQRPGQFFLPWTRQPDGTRSQPLVAVSELDAGHGEQQRAFWAEVNSDRLLLDMSASWLHG